jgi:hypothetical protein
VLRMRGVLDEAADVRSVRRAASGNSAVHAARGIAAGSLFSRARR